MKKIFTLLAFAAGCSLATAQTEFTQDEITYVTTGTDQVGIKKCRASGDIILPATVVNDGQSFYVKSIQQEAFKWSSITSVVLPSTLDTIGYQAFGGCDKLTSITFPEKLSVIEPYAFSSCKIIENITLPAGIKAIPNNTFFTCYALRSITIPDGVKYIGSGAFYKTAIESIEIPESCDSIAKTAFLFCSQLNSIKLPKSLRYLGPAALQGCTKLTEFTIPEKIDSLSDELLMECSNLTTLHIPTTLTKIGRSVFAHSGIKNFTIDADHPTFKLVDEGLYDKSQKLLMAFPMRGITSLSIPNGVIGIWGGAFYGSDIASVVLPETMKAIDESAFAESQLSSINFPESLIFLGPTALYRTQFTEITLPVNNKILYDGLIAYCPNLVSVTIPANVTYIDSHVFSQNKKLTKLTCLGSTPPTLYDYYEEDDNPFGWVNRDAITVNVPAGSLDAYKASAWKIFRNISEMAAPTLSPITFVPEKDSPLKSLTSVDIQFDEPVSIVSKAAAPVLRKGSVNGTPVAVTSKWSVITSPDDKSKQTIRIVSFDYDGYTEYFSLDPDSEYFMVIPAGAVKGNTSSKQNEEIVIRYTGTNVVSSLSTVEQKPLIYQNGNQTEISLANEGIFDIAVYSMTGTQIYSKTVVSGVVTLPCMAKGTYMVRITSGKKTHTVKFVQAF